MQMPPFCAKRNELNEFNDSQNIYNPLDRKPPILIASVEY